MAFLEASYKWTIDCVLQQNANFYLMYVRFLTITSFGIYHKINLKIDEQVQKKS